MQKSIEAVKLAGEILKTLEGKGLGVKSEAMKHVLVALEGEADEWQKSGDLAGADNNVCNDGRADGLDVAGRNDGGYTPKNWGVLGKEEH